MVEYGKYLILENSQEFSSKWDERWHLWDHSYVAEKPTFYPCAFIWKESYDPKSCGSWFPIDIKEAEIAIRKRIDERLKEIQKTIDILDRL